MCDVMKLHGAFERGDLEALRSELGDPPDFPNSPSPSLAIGNFLEYAIYHSPLPFIRTLLELGADPNYGDHAGFPSIIAALSSQRPEKYQIVEMMLTAGADIRQRGVNDYTPLHYAATVNDGKAVDLLLRHGADPSARTNIDSYTTPLEEAETLGARDAARILREFADRKQK
jgi:ankyrin repeat protein